MKIFVPIAFALVAASLPTNNFVRPADIELQNSLNELEVCRSPNASDCWSPRRAYKVHGAVCIPIAPEDARTTIACRIDLTLTFEDPTRGYTRYHDSCIRLSKRGPGDGKPEWEVIQVRDRPCEMPSMLIADPNSTPEKAHIESALAGMLTCHDLDGTTDCFAQPERARVQAFRCKRIPPEDEYQVRVACRVTGEVFYSTRRLMRRFRNDCIHFNRITPADESPASWTAIYVQDKARCEVQ